VCDIRPEAADVRGDTRADSLGGQSNWYRLAEPPDSDSTEVKLRLADPQIMGPRLAGCCVSPSLTDSSDELVDVANTVREPMTCGDRFTADCVSNAVDTNTVNVDCDASRVYVVSSNDEEYGHVQPVVDKLPACLTPEQRNQAIELIKRNADIFSQHEFDVGCTNLLTANIETGNHPPIAEPLRRHARVHLDTIDETIQKMEKAGIVQRCSSPWASNLVMVPRKDDQGRPTTPRVTIDFRKLNAITYKDKYPIPNIKDCLQSLTDLAFVFSIDLSNSFYQVGIREQDQDKTAFVIRQGQFRLTRLAMGCTNSPSCFSKLMAMVIRGLKCCLAFIDDTICFSPSFDDPLVDLQTLFDRFRSANLKLKPTKCKRNVTFWVTL